MVGILLIDSCEGKRIRPEKPVVKRRDFPAEFSLDLFPCENYTFMKPLLARFTSLSTMAIPSRLSGREPRKLFHRAASGRRFSWWPHILPPRWDRSRR